MRILPGKPQQEAITRGTVLRRCCVFSRSFDAWKGAGRHVMTWAALFKTHCSPLRQVSSGRLCIQRKLRNAPNHTNVRRKSS